MKTQIQSYTSNLIAIAILALAVVLWFHPFFISGEMLIPPNANSTYPWVATDAALDAHPQGSWDTTRENYITWALHKDYITNGHAPYWQPYFLSGNPLLANQFAIPYSPFKLLNYVMDAPLAWSWAQILKSFMAGLFCFGTIRLLGRSAVASLIGALAWMLSWPLAHQTQTTYNEGVALISVITFFLILCFQAQSANPQIRIHRLKWVWGGFAALAAGSQLLSGNIQMSIYGFALVFALAFWWSVANTQGSLLKRLTPLLTIIVIYAVGTLISAIQLWSSYELLGYSIRGVSQTHTNKGIEPYTLLSMLNPWLYFWQNFEFSQLRDTYWLNYRWNPYMGLLPAFAVVVALRFAKDRLARAMLVFVLIIWAVLHLVYFRPIFNIVSQLPAYDALEQTRLLIVIMFPMAILSAYGIDWLLEHGQTEWKKLRPFVILFGFLLPVMVGLLLAVMQRFSTDLSLAEALPDTYDNQRTLIGTQVLADYYHLANPLFIVSLVSVGLLSMLLWLYGTQQVGKRGFTIAIVTITFFEMITFAQVNVASTPRDLVYPSTPAIEWLQTQAETDEFRIHTVPNTLIEGRDEGDYSQYRDDHSWFIAGLTHILTPNTPALFGLQDIRGYESVLTLNYSRYLAEMDGRETIFSALVTPEIYQHPMLDALNMRYVLSIEPIDDEGLTEVYNDEILIYENENALPRVMLYDGYTVLDSDEDVLDALTAPDYDPQTMIYFSGQPPFPPPAPADLSDANVDISQYDPNEVIIQVETPADAILVLADEYYAGWEALLNGEEIPIARVNTLLRAVEITEGEHELIFRYNPPSLQITSWISLGSTGLTILIMMVTMGRVILMRRKDPTLELDHSTSQ